MVDGGGRKQSEAARRTAGKPLWFVGPRCLACLAVVEVASKQLGELQFKVGRRCRVLTHSAH